MVTTISILANTVRPSVDHRLDDTTFGAGTFSWEDPVHSWKAGPGKVITVENLFVYLVVPLCLVGALGHLWNAHR